MCIPYSQSDNSRWSGRHAEYEIYKQGIAVHVRSVLERVHAADGHSPRYESPVPIMGTWRPFVCLHWRHDEVLLHPFVVEDNAESVLQMRKLTSGG
jgi:hypothetical protein